MKNIPWNIRNLWEGCILSSIAHAVSIAEYPELANEHSWDGFNYNIQDNSGGRGTLTFHSKYLVAAFRDDNGERIENCQDALMYFQDAPSEVKEIATTETLQYLLDDFDGQLQPSITTSFWSVEDKIYSQDDLSDLIENGGFLLEHQSADFDEAIENIQEYYELSDIKIDLIKTIFNRKIKNPSEEIILNQKQIEIIDCGDEEGLKESEESFSELGIKWSK